MSTEIDKQLKRKFEEVTEKVVVANGNVSDTIGSVTGHPGCFEQIQILLGFLVVGDPLFKSILGLPAFKTLHSFISSDTKPLLIRHE